MNPERPLAYQFIDAVLYCEECRSPMMRLDRPCQDGTVRVKCFGPECSRNGKTFEIDLPSVPMRLVSE